MALTLALTSLAAVAPANAAYPGSNGKIAFTRSAEGTQDVFVMSADGTGVTNLTNGAIQALAPAWSPDGSQIAFYGSDGTACTAIYVGNATLSSYKQLTSGSECDSTPAWSPDGTMIVFQRDAHVDGGGSSYDILVMKADGSGVRNVTGDYPSNEQLPAWSPDGSKIVYSVGTSIYSVNPDGTGQEFVTAGHDAAWSPNGAKLAFVRDTGNVNGGLVWDIFVSNADGSNAVNLTNSSSRNFSPAWSPDGSRIIFESTREAADPTNCDSAACDYEIYSIPSGGGAASPLTDYDWADRYADWQPRCTITGRGTITGTAGRDIICGSPASDTISGLGGNDVIYGLGGNDVLKGAGGDDLVWGGNGGDRLVGGAGADVHGGGPGADVLSARDGISGNDRLDGGPSSDTCQGDPGDVRVSCP
ncbi:MAG: hypothetical protein WEE66_08590 [Actinomycetota bacterium]